MGFNDTCAAGTSVLIALATGKMIAWAGLSAAGLMAMFLALPPLVMLIIGGSTKRLTAASVAVENER